MVKTYMGLKVGVIFDPPLSSVVMEAKNRMISEMEWRLNAAVDPQDNVMNQPVDPIDPLDNADPNAEFEDQEDLNDDDINELFGN